MESIVCRTMLTVSIGEYETWNFATLGGVVESDQLCNIGFFTLSKAKILGLDDQAMKELRTLTS